MPTLEQRVDDIAAVMATSGFKRTVLLSCSEGGLTSMMFAATYPERISHVILFGTFARFLGTDDDPFMHSEEELFRLIDRWAERWGDGIRCALALSAAVEHVGLQLRAGLHTGEIEAGEDDVAEVGVHAAARAMAQ
jgi:pimeloyl-ACP methyl ester carboxylesterase